MKFFKIAGYAPETTMTLYRDTIGVVEPLLEGEWTTDPTRRGRHEEMLGEKRRAMIADAMSGAKGFNPQYRVDVGWIGNRNWVQNHPEAPHGAVEGTYEIRVTFDVVDPQKVDELVYEVLRNSTRTI